MKEKIKIDLVVTRHPALLEYLEEIGFNLADVESATHATPDMVRGKTVCGVLPHSLSCLADLFVEIPMKIPAEKRGYELDIRDMRRYASDPVVYRIEEIL